MEQLGRWQLTNQTFMQLKCKLCTMEITIYKHTKPLTKQEKN
jgi:ribosomal protein S27E